MSVPSITLAHVFIRKFVAFSGYTFLVYDYLLTLSLEITYVWNAPWSIVKILFLMNRYWTLVGQTFLMLEETGYLSRGSERFCTAFELFLPFFVIISGESVRLLVVMRAAAILGCKRRVTITWSAFYVLYAMAVLGVVCWFFDHGGPMHFEYLDETGICIAPVPPKLWTILFVTLILDSFILVLVGYSLHRVSRGSNGVHPSRLICLLARDAIMFYMATLFNTLLCIVCWTVYIEDPRNMIQQLVSVPFLCVMGQRLVLNLRRFRSRPDSTRDISREVARQMAALPIYSDVDEVGEEESDPQSTDLGLELDRLRGGRCCAGTAMHR